MGYFVPMVGTEQRVVAPKARRTASTKADCVFAFLAKAAAKNVRCPTNSEIAQHLHAKRMSVSAGTVPGIVSQLAREGRIAVRLYSRLWREVVICEGPQMGRGTLPPPHGGKPFRVIGRP